MQSLTAGVARLATTAQASLLAVGDDLVANADIVSSTGNISLVVSKDIRLNSTASLRTGLAGTGSGSIDVESLAGSIVQSATSQIVSNSATAQARLVAAQSVTVGDITLAGGKVSVTALAGSVLDADALVTSGATAVNDVDQDITAASVRIAAGVAVAASVNHLETSADTLTARASGGGIWLLEADNATIGDVAVTVNRVLTDGTLTLGGGGASTLIDPTQSDVSTTGANGSIVLRSTAGNLVLTDGSAGGMALSAVSAHGSGNVLVQTLGVGSNIQIDADVASTNGSLSVIAKGSVNFGAAGDLRTTSTAAGTGSIDVWAETGSITQDASSLIVSTGSTAVARLRAGSNVTLGDVQLSVGTVSVVSDGGSILDADPLASTNDSDQDITAALVRLNAGVAIAQSVNHLETTAGTLSASAAAGGIWVLEADALVVDTVSATVNRVLSDGTVTNSTVADAAQSDVRTLGVNGSIVLRTTAGTLTLNNGSSPGAASTPADQSAVVAHGSGNVLLQALGSATDIVLNADVSSTSGNLSVIAKGAVTFAADADLRTTSTGATSGSIDVWAETGAIAQNASS
ncbi:MAG: hypothetical protein EB027_06110, partial [Actinobacteria bacterium]|nr:hypothetical protein [Actinomycetota bacterium]